VLTTVELHRTIQRNHPRTCTYPRIAFMPAAADCCRRERFLTVAAACRLHTVKSSKICNPLEMQNFAETECYGKVVAIYLQYHTHKPPLINKKMQHGTPNRMTC
jgi:hypothetical protein